MKLTSLNFFNLFIQSNHEAIVLVATPTFWVPLYIPSIIPGWTVAAAPCPSFRTPPPQRASIYFLVRSSRKVRFGEVILVASSNKQSFRIRKTCFLECNKAPRCLLIGLFLEGLRRTCVVLLCLLFQVLFNILNLNLEDPLLTSACKFKHLVWPSLFRNLIMIQKRGLLLEQRQTFAFCVQNLIPARIRQSRARNKLYKTRAYPIRAIFSHN